MKCYPFLICSLFIFLNVFGTPYVNHVSPRVGLSQGETVVTITGSGFTGVKGINFGSTPAASFKLNSDTSITAISPPHSPQVISVAVTTEAGTSITTGDSFFTYKGNWHAYVTNSNDSTVSVMDTGTHLVNTIQVGGLPDALAITPDGTKGYVANYGNFTGDSVSVIDTATNEVTDTITVGGGPNAVGITPDGTKAYVANYGDTTVSVIDTETNAIISTLIAGNAPVTLAFTPNGAKGYVANYNDNTVSVIDIETNTVSGLVSVGFGPVSAVVTPDGTECYVANFRGNTVSVINTATETISTITVGSEPNALAITPNGSHVFVANSGANTVSVIDTSTHTVNATLIVGSGPFLAIITPDGKKAYVANYNDNTVSIINTATYSVSGPFAIGKGANAVAIAPNGAHIFFANYLDNDIVIIDTSINTVNFIPVGNAPTQIAITPDQAPLAKFTASLVSGSLTCEFDASQSESPTGSIAKYFWDFGDGITFSTTYPTKSHVYEAPGAYTVKLTVTNSSGTSTKQVFSYHAFSNNNFGSCSMPMTHNGSPTATASLAIMID